MYELNQKPVWTQIGPWRVSSELFLDIVMTSRCNCACPWCIARTRSYAQDDPSAWRKGLRDAFEMFPIRNVILLGGEATIDPLFWEKLEALEKVIASHPVDHLILTTNGTRLAEGDFLKRLLASRIDAINLSRMHDDQSINDSIFGKPTPGIEEIRNISQRLHDAGKNLRLNVNVWRGNLDHPEEMNRFVSSFAGACDAIKFTPLMRTEMFDTCPDVTAYCREHAIPEEEIRSLWDSFADAHIVLRRQSQVLGFVDYAEVEAFGQRVILKYAQVEDKYDRDREIPTLKLYPNGCLSNEWSYLKDVRNRMPNPS